MNVESSFVAKVYPAGLSSLLLRTLCCSVDACMTQSDGVLMCSQCRTESFEQRVLYDVPIHMNRYPALAEYIHSMLAGCRAWLHSGELEKLCIVVLSDQGRTLETLVVETRWAMAATRDGAEAAGGGATVSTSLTVGERGQDLPLLKIEEAFRAALVALVAAPRPTKSHLKPNSFRILVHTIENSSNPETSVAETSSVENSWVLADPFWHDDDESKQENEKLQLLPLKSVRANELPFTIQLYLEEPSV